jgi:hypothetical protein
MSNPTWNDNKGHDRNFVACMCNYCGTMTNVKYDYENDVYICIDCIRDEENNKNVDYSDNPED